MGVEAQGQNWGFRDRTEARAVAVTSSAAPGRGLREQSQAVSVRMAPRLWCRHTVVTRSSRFKGSHCPQGAPAQLSLLPRRPGALGAGQLWGAHDSL